MNKPQRTIKDGIIQIENPRGEHWYASPKDGRWLPSVTMITSVFPKGYGFSQWLGNQESFQEAERLKEEAGERGTRVHRACEILLLGESLRFADYESMHNLNFWQSVEEWKMIEAFQRWVERTQPEVLKTERSVISEVNGYGGTFDLACEIDDELHIVDFKTSSSIYPSHWLQVQAYAWAAQEMKMFEEEPKIAILQFNKKTKVGYKFEAREWDADLFRIFLACQKIWKHANPNLDGPEMLELREVVEIPKGAR